ncbi:MAG: hypothetical protein ACE365_00250 [Gammaproteobacteria bacterium]
MNLPIWMRTVDDLEKYRIEGIYFNYHDGHGSSYSREQFEETRKYKNQAIAHVQSLYNVRTGIIDSLLNEYFRIMLKLEEAWDSVSRYKNKLFFNSKSVKTENTKLFSVQGVIADILKKNKLALDDVKGRIVILVKNTEVDLNQGRTRYKFTEEIKPFFAHLVKRAELKPYLLTEMLSKGSLSFKITIRPNFYHAHLGESCALAATASVYVDLEFNGRSIARYFPGVENFISITDEGNYLTCLGDRELGRVHSHDAPEGYRGELGLYHRTCSAGMDDSRGYHPVKQNDLMVKQIKNKILKPKWLSRRQNYYFATPTDWNFDRMFDAFIDSERLIKANQNKLRIGCSHSINPFFNFPICFELFDLKKTNKKIKNRLTSNLNTLPINLENHDYSKLRTDTLAKLRSVKLDPAMAYRFLFERFKKQKLEAIGMFIQKLEDVGELFPLLEKLDTVYWLLKHYIKLFGLDDNFIEKHPENYLRMACLQFDRGAEKTDHLSWIKCRSDNLTFYNKKRFIKKMKDKIKYLKNYHYKKKIDLSLGDLVDEQLKHDLGKKYKSEVIKFNATVNEHKMTNKNNEFLKSLHRGGLALTRTEQRIQLYIDNLATKQHLSNIHDNLHCDGPVEECSSSTGNCLDVDGRPYCAMSNSASGSMFKLPRLTFKFYEDSYIKLKVFGD